MFGLAGGAAEAVAGRARFALTVSSTMQWSADRWDQIRFVVILVRMVRGPPRCNTHILPGPLDTSAGPGPHYLYLWPGRP